VAVLTVRHVVDRVPAADGRGNLDRGERIRRCRVDKGRALPEPPGVMLCAWCRHAPCRRHDHDHDDHAPGRAAHLPRVAVEPDLGNLQAAATTGHQTIPTNSSDDRPSDHSNEQQRRQAIRPFQRTAATTGHAVAPTSVHLPYPLGGGMPTSRRKRPALKREL
jgi:hypothetical protein